jgi:glutathione S-transferase
MKLNPIIMSDRILTTFDWVPEPPRGYVRDIRVRWALEEAGLPLLVDRDT